LRSDSAGLLAPTLKKTTTVGTKKTIKYRITNIRVPLLSAQSGSIQMISGATDTSYAFEQSLQAALLKLK